MQIQAEACKYKIGQENNKTSNAKQDMQWKDLKQDTTWASFLENLDNFADLEEILLNSSTVPSSKNQSILFR